MGANSTPSTVKRCFLCAGLILLAVTTVPSPQSFAGERYLEFLRALRNRGYSDMAVYYARQLRARRAELPSDVAAKLDLEYADVLVDAARVAPQDEANQLLDEAAQILSEYAREHEGTLDALDAALRLATLEMERGNTAVARAKATGNQQLLATARRHFAAARQTLEQLVEQARALERRAREQKTRRSEQADQARALQHLARLNHALTYYYEALTYDERQQQRTRLLLRAAQLFDALYQENRLTLTVATLYAHLWHGRCYQEMGQFRDAIDIYDEVLVAEPPVAENLSPAEAELFTKAYLFRLECMEKLGQIREIVEHEVYGVEQWLRSHRALRNTSGYAQVQLIAAKVYMTLARNERQENRKRRLLQTALELLREASTIAGPHQAEAVQLTRSLELELRGGTTEPRTWDEAIALGNIALNTKDWSGAIAYYEKAFQLPQRGISPQEKATIRYRLAYAYYQKGDPVTASRLAQQILRDSPQSPVAVDAATLALYGQYAQLRAARAPAERDAQFRTLENLAQQVLALWPDEPVADLARYLLGLAYWQRGEPETAAQYLGAVRPEFPDYPRSLLYAAQALWTAEARQASGGRTAGGRLQSILELAQKAVKAAGDNVQIAAEGLLLQAQLYLQMQQPDRAKPLAVEAIRRLQGVMSPQASTLRVRAYTLALQLASATNDNQLLGQLVEEIATAVESGSQTVGTDVLAFVVGQLTRQYSQAKTQVEKDQIARTLETLLGLLNPQERTDPRWLRYLAEAHYVLALHNDSSEEYRMAATFFERLLKSTQDRTSQAFYRLRIAACYRATRNYEAAHQQLQALLAAYGGRDKAPVSVQMELARTLYKWAQEDPAKMQDAAAAWNRVSNLLARRRPRPREYYEAQYFLAKSLAALGQRQEARALVERILRLSPTAGGGDLKRKFEELRAELEDTG